MEKEIKLQDILFPVGEKYEPEYNLYYRGEEKKLSPDGTLHLKAGETLDCMAYFNTISLCKWKEYSNVSGYKLKLSVQGDFTLQLMGYSVHDNPEFDEDAEIEQDEYEEDDSLDTQRIAPYISDEYVFEEKEYSFAEKTEIVLTYPETEALLGTFQLKATGKCVFYGGCYEGTIDEENIQDVCLSVATTTFKKEDFIIPNIAQIKKDILETDDELAQNLYVHVVDNGRSLLPEQIEGRHVFLHPNPNTGGSGGYARGMIETLRQKRPATHILLMDDDILIQTESLKRTYRLLKVLKEEYRGHFISGAMLFYEKMHLQHEDVGYANEEGTYGPVKPLKDFHKIIDCCSNELPWKEREYQYCGWWYCCIPMQYVREDNLPLPFFVRGDDVEYSLRNHAKFITMNGICVWHMGFTQKFNAMMELYQVHRNSLMLQAISGVCDKLDFAHRMKMFTRVELLRFNYNSAELLLEAMDDYLKGPHFLDRPEGENIIREKGKKNEKLIPLSEFPDIQVDLKKIYRDVPLSALDLWMYRLSYNGLYLPDSLLKDEPGVIAYDWFYAKGKQALRKSLLAVNIHEKTGAMRVLDRKRAKEIKKRAKQTFKKYYETKEALQREYAENQKRFTSIEFWEEYLGI